MLALIPFLLILAGVGLIPLAARRPQLVVPTAVSLTGISLLVWLIARTQLPITLNLSHWADSGFLSGLVWQVDLLNWQVTFAILLLMMAICLSKLDLPLPESSHLPHLFLQTAVSLLAIWSNNLPTIIAGLTLLILPWLVAVWQQMTHDNTRLLRFMAMLIASLMCLWYAAAISPGSDNWQLQSFGTSGSVAVAIVAAILVGIWPFFVWWLRLTAVPGSTAIMTFVLPTAIGGIIFARQAEAIQPGMNLQLLVTLLALFGVLQSVRLAWAHLQSPRHIALAILFAQAQLVVLTGIWTTGAAVVAELRVLILAGGILFLAAEERPSRERFWTFLAPIVAIASIAALPLTAGFVGRAALYSAWIENGRFLLAIVLAFLTVPLITGVYLRFWPPQTDETNNEPAPSSLLTLNEIGRDGGVILLALGQFTILGIGWGAVHWLAWILLLLTAVAGLILPRFLGEMQRVQTLFEQAFSLGERWQPERFQGVLRDVGTAVRDAARILEGEGGLVWLFVLAVLFFLLS